MTSLRIVWHGWPDDIQTPSAGAAAAPFLLGDGFAAQGGLNAETPSKEGRESP